MKHVSRKARTNRIITNTLIYIVLICISVVWLLPFLYLIVQSLTSSPGISTNLWPNFPTVKDEYWTIWAYKALFTQTETYNFGRWYLNTLCIAAITSVCQTVITLLVAYTFSRLRFKGRKSLMKFMLIITMFPGFLSMICIYSVLKNLGLAGNVNSPIGNIGGLILVYIAGSATGYMISKGFFDTISRSLDEAAEIDGASKNRIFWNIILPLSKPIVVYTILTTFTGPWGDFMFASMILGKNRDSYTVAIGLQQFIGQTTIGTYWSRFCAGGVIVSIPIVILFFFLQKYYVSGITGGAVKG